MEAPIDFTQYRIELRPATGGFDVLVWWRNRPIRSDGLPVGWGCDEEQALSVAHGRIFRHATEGMGVRLRAQVPVHVAA